MVAKKAVARAQAAQPNTSKAGTRSQAKKTDARGGRAVRSVAATTSTPASTDSAHRDAPGQSPRESRRLQRIETSRQQILDTAERLFAARGYYETNLKDVAEACEFSIGSIYSFFESKDDLYKQVLMRHSIALESIQQLAPASMPADNRLVELARIQIEHAQRYPDWATLTSEISRISRQPGSARPEVWVEYYNETMQFLTGVIKTGQKEGTLRAGSPTALAHLYQAINMAFILVSALTRSPSTDGKQWSSDVDEYLSFVQDTFATSPARPGMMRDFDE